MMRFCPKDGTLLTAKKKGSSTVLFCRKCGKTFKAKAEKLTIKEPVEKEKKAVVVMRKDEGDAELPSVSIMCPKCGNMEAYWWMQQTRGADEPPTMFYKCKKCKYSWRVYG